MPLELEEINDVGGEEKKSSLQLEPLDLEPIEGEKKKTGSKSPSLSLEESGSNGQSTSTDPSTKVKEQPFSWEATLNLPQYKAHPQPVLKPVSTVSRTPGTITPEVKAPTKQEKITQPMIDAFTDAPDVFVNIDTREKLYRKLYDRLHLDAGSGVEEYKVFRDKAEKAWQNAYGIQEFQKKVNSNPNDQEARYLLATHQLESGKENDAANNYRDLLQQNPKFTPAYTGLAFIAGQNGHDDLAIGELNVGIEENPGDPVLRNNRAIYKQRLGDYQGAVADLDGAISLTKNPHLLQEMYTQRAKIYGRLAQDPPLVEQYIKKLRGENDPLAEEIDKEFFLQRYREDKATALRLASVAEQQDKKSAQDTYELNKKKIAAGEKPDFEQYVETIEDKQAGYVRGKGMIEAMESFADPTQMGLAGLIINPAGFIVSGGLKGMMSGIKDTGEGVKEGNVAKALKGVAEVGIAGLMASTPVGVAFTAGTTAVNELPYGEYVTSLIMAPVSTALEAVGEKPGDVAGLADLIVGGLLLHKANSGIKGVKEVAKKIENKQPLTPEDINIYKAAIENLGDIEVKEVIGKELESMAEPVSGKEMSREKIMVQKNMLAEKRPDLKEVIDNKPVDEMISEMQERGLSVNAAGMEKYFDKVGIGEIKKPALSKEEQIRFEELSKEDADLLSVEEKVELEGLRKKAEPVEEVVVAEAKVEPVKETKGTETTQAQRPKIDVSVKEKFTSADGKYTAERSEEGLVVKDATGKEVADKVKARVTKEYEDAIDYSKGKTAEAIGREEKMEFADADEAAKYTAENSFNPLEVIRAYESVEPFESRRAYEDQIMEDMVSNVDPVSYNRFGDRNKVSQTMAKRFFKTGGRRLDDLAIELTDMAGKEVTPQDIVNFVENYTYERKTNPVKVALAERFKKLTGVTLNERVKQKALDQELKKYNKDYDRFLNKENRDLATAEREYTEAIQRGEIPIEESAERSVAEGVSGSKKEVVAEASPSPFKGATLDEKIKELENTIEEVKRARGQSAKDAVTKAAESIKNILRTPGTEGFDVQKLGGSVDVNKLVDKAVKLIHKGIDAGLAIEEAVKKAIEQIKTTDLYKKISGSKDFKEADFDAVITSKFDAAKKDVPAETFEEASVRAEEYLKPKPGQERKSFIDTVKQGEKTTEGMKKATEDLDEFYKVITNKETLKKADSEIREDLGEVKKEVLSESTPSADKSAKAIRLIKHYESIKDYDSAIDILDSFDKQLREAGRFIQAASMWNKLAPETMLRNANKVFRKITKKEDLPKGVQKVILEKMQEIDKMAEGDGKTKATMEMLSFIADQMPLTFREKFDAYRYQNMLSNPRSHERNIYSNLLNTFLVRPLDIASTATYELLRSPFNPVARDYKLANAPKYLQSAVNNIPNAWTAAVEAFKQGYVSEKIMDIGDTSSMIEAMRRTKLPKYLTVVSRLMEAQDRFFSTIIAESEKIRLLKNGLSEHEATIRGKKVGETYLYRDRLGVANADMPIISRALDQAGAWIIKGRNESLLGNALSWFVPFVTTPINVAKFGIERSPLGFIGGKYGRTQVANATLGTLVTGVGAMLAAQDRTTWAAPQDKKEKELFYASGRKPYSIKIGDKWVPLTYFGPYALALALPAAYKNFKYDTKTSVTADEFDIIKDATIGIGGFISQQTPLSGLGGMFKAIEGKDDYKLPQALAFTSEQAIPLIGLVKYINSILDPIYRKASGTDPKTGKKMGYLESIQKDLPGLSQDLPFYKTPKGEPAKREPMNYWLPYDLGFEDKEFEKLLEKRRKLLKKRELNKDN